MDRTDGKPRGARAIGAHERLMVEPSEERVERTAPSGGMLRSVERADSLVALQKSAARLQHAMNNPLAALLAEGQLLAMEASLTAEQRDAVDRMIELTRRVIVLTRDLDGLRGSHPPR